jgi:hypothetical protein
MAYYAQFALNENCGLHDNKPSFKLAGFVDCYGPASSMSLSLGFFLQPLQCSLAA